MFDPTAFENMKVVMEGCLYDYDLDGEIIITDRNDWVNLAKLSRKFEMTLRKNPRSKVFCTFILQADLANLTAELLPLSNGVQQSGASVFIKTTLEHPENEELYKKSAERLKTIWGANHSVQQHIRKNALNEHAHLENELTISFNRLIQEDQIDDLQNMAEYMVKTVNEMDHLIRPFN